MLSFNFGSSCKFFILASSHSFLYLPTSVGHTLLPDPASMHHSVHPHLCGAYVVGMDAPPVVGGSSPPTWGIRRVRGQERAERRFIPTYVGHTLSPSRIPRAIPVHPHLRGAYSASLTTAAAFLRFIPTYVGHTFLACNLANDCTVHPHLGGAYSFDRGKQDYQCGSSPPTWGIRKMNEDTGNMFRFIPTYVGHTFWWVVCYA